MTKPSAGADARIDELEARFAHQDHAIVELGNEIYRQQQQIAQLEAMLRQLADRTQAIEQSRSDGGSAHEVPPHY